MSLQHYRRERKEELWEAAAMDEDKLSQLAYDVQQLDSRLLALEARVDEAHVQRLVDGEVHATSDFMFQSQLDSLRETLEEMTERERN